MAIKDKLASRIKVISRLDIAEKRLPQDGRIALRIAGRPVDVVRAGARWTSADGAYVVPTELVRDGPGAYAATGTALPVAGQWRLELTTRTSDINSTRNR